MTEAKKTYDSRHDHETPELGADLLSFLEMSDREAGDSDETAEKLLFSLALKSGVSPRRNN